MSHLRSTRWRGRALWLGLGALVAGYACEPTVVTRAYLQDFEGERCDGAPCGWERSTGTPEQATWVETIHPGEHALRLSGIVSVRGPGSDVVLVGPDVILQMTARCDPGSNLAVDVIVVDELGTRPLRVDPIAADAWSLTSVTLGGGGDISNSRIAAIALIKTGSTSCEIGEIWVDEVGFGNGLTCS